MANNHGGDAGKIHISQTAIATIASQAVLKSYGVMGMASRTFVRDLAGSVSRDPNQGIAVNVDSDNEITINVYVIIAYGTRIWMVADSIIDTVRFDVEKALTLPVKQVNVHVQGLMIREIE